jgi:hypothetical protein
VNADFAALGHRPGVNHALPPAGTRREGAGTGQVECNSDQTGSRALFRYTSDRSNQLADEPLSDFKQHHPHTLDSLPILPGPLTPEEIQNEAERAAALAEKQADAGYKERQLALTKSANRLTATNVILTWLLAVFTAIGAGAAWYQGVIANRNAQSAKISADAAKSAADTAVVTLNEMKADAQKTLRASNDAMDIDQRAWVGLFPLEFPTDAANINVEQRGSASNSGKTPARDVHAVMGVYTHFRNPDHYTPVRKDFDWIMCIEKEAWNNEIKQTDFLYASFKPPYKGRCGLPPLRDRLRDWVGVPQIRSLGVIPPGNTPYKLPLPLTESLREYDVIFYGEIRYTDFAGQGRSTEFCYYEPAASNSFYQCDKLNDMN